MSQFVLDRDKKKPQTLRDAMWEAWTAGCRAAKDDGHKQAEERSLAVVRDYIRRKGEEHAAIARQLSRFGNAAEAEKTARIITGFVEEITKENGT